MRSLVFAAVLLGTITAVAAKEADTSGATKQSSVAASRQLVINAGAASASGPQVRQESRQQAGQAARQPADFSAERLIPDICRGC
jgi:hypothetical protein